MVTGLQSSMLFDRQGDGRRKEEFELLQVSLGVTKYIYIKSTTVYAPSSELGLSQPSIASVYAPPPGNKGGGGTLACG